MTERIRVMVVDDHTLFRQGIVSLLASQPDIEVVGEAGDAEEAIERAVRLAPDVLLMDVTMPGESGLDATIEIKNRCPDLRILMLTIHDREDYLYRALRAGASGYVLKGADINDLLTAVRTAHSGNIYLSPNVTKTLVADYLRQAKSGVHRLKFDGLSEREREILRFIAEGKTTPEIASALYLSPHTVQSHRDNIMAKLDLHSKAALIRYAIAKGLIEL